MYSAALRLQYLLYEVLYKNGMFLGVFRFAKKMKILNKGEIRCTLYIFLGVLMLYAGALIGRTDDGLAQYSSVFSNNFKQKPHTSPALPPRLL